MEPNYIYMQNDQFVYPDDMRRPHGGYGFAWPLLGGIAGGLLAGALITPHGYGYGYGPPGYGYPSYGYGGYGAYGNPYSYGYGFPFGY
ncbi:hypothetical protein [Oceanobacillus massiliensis]|uniref:hypothetical protein n=1 Tax=Oceanobacillus massiliensis TaxID=1465765 RepID=UPI000287D6BB|nr:hypothetical protein [Oceanobacillus massiliensis]